MHTNIKNINNFAILLYFFTILFVEVLIGQFKVDIFIARGIVGCFFVLWFGLVYLRHPRFTVDTPLVLLVIFAVYASIVGILLHFSLAVLLRALAIPVVYFFLLQTFQTLDDIKKIIVSLGRLSSLFILLNILYIIFLPGHVFAPNIATVLSPHLYWGLGYNPNASAGVLMVTMLFLVGNVIFSNNKKEKYLMLFLIILNMALLMLTGSRAASFAIFTFFIMLGAYYLWKFNPKCMYAVLISLFVLGVVVLIFKYNDSNPQNYSGHFFNFSLDGRIAIWKCGISEIMSTHKFIWGIGLGNQYQIIHELCKFPVYQAHNSYLDVFIGTGVAGIVLFLLFIYKLVSGVIKQFLLFKSIHSFFFIAAICALLIQAMVESYLINEVSPNWFCLIVLYMMAIHIKKEERQSK